MSPTMTWFTSHTGKQVTTDTRQHVPGHTANVCQSQSWPCLYILASTPVSSLLLISWLQERTSVSDSVHDQCLCLTARSLTWYPATRVSPATPLPPPWVPSTSGESIPLLVCAPHMSSSSHAKSSVPYPISFPTHCSTFYSIPTFPSMPPMTILLAPTFLFSSPITS